MSLNVYMNIIKGAKVSLHDGHTGGMRDNSTVWLDDVCLSISSASEGWEFLAAVTKLVEAQERYEQDVRVRDLAGLLPKALDGGVLP